MLSFLGCSILTGIPAIITGHIAHNRFRKAPQDYGGGGFAIAGLDTTVIGARVGPRVGANRWRVRRLVEQTRHLITRYTGRAPAAIRSDRLLVSHDLYGGAYARPHPTAEHAAVLVNSLRGWKLDATYSAKAFGVALDLAAAESTPTLFWMTFDARWMKSFGQEPQQS